MKTFIIKICVKGTSTVQGGRLNMNTGKWEYSPRPGLSAQQINEFVAETPVYKKEAYDVLKPMLAKGNFIFDPTLWKWSYTYPNKYRFELWLTMTFTDTDNEGEKTFMNDVRKTGILNLEHTVIKKYS